MGRGRITVATPRTCVVAGELTGEKMSAGKMVVQTSSPVGAVAAQSLDGQPLENSRHYLVKMVTVAENTGQKLNPTPPGAPSTHILDQPGLPPVLTFGTPSDRGTTVVLADSEVVRVGMDKGVWELLESVPKR